MTKKELRDQLLETTRLAELTMGGMHLVRDHGPWTKWLAKSHPFHAWNLVACPLFAVIAVIIAMLPVNSLGWGESGAEILTGCQRSYAFLAGLIVWRTAGYFLKAVRDGAIFPHAKHGQPIPPEAHFLAGSIPGALAPTKVLAFGGFAFGILGMFIGIFQMNTEISRKYYLMQTMLLVLSASIGYSNSHRDRFDLKIWEWEIGSKRDCRHHHRLHSHSARVVHACKLLLYSNTAAMRPLVFIWFIILVLSIVPTVFSILLLTSGIEGVHMFTIGPVVVGGLALVDACINIAKVEYRKYMLKKVATILEHKLNCSLMSGAEPPPQYQQYGGGYDDQGYGGHGGQQQHGGPHSQY